MKITASRKDDILRQREEYDAEYKRYKEREEESHRSYRRAVDEEAKKIESAVADAIGNTTLELQFTAEPSGWGHAEGWRVRVDANRRSGDSVALRWEWSASLDREGNVDKESGSWSGLNAVTEAQLDDLAESVRVLRELNNMDWDTVLRTAVPSYNDFNDKEAANKAFELSKNRPAFEDELVEADIEDAIEVGNVALKLDQDQYWNGICWILPTKISPKFVTGYIFPNYYTKEVNFNVDRAKQVAGELRRTSRNNLVIHNGNVDNMVL